MRKCYIEIAIVRQYKIMKTTKIEKVYHTF